MVPVVPCSASNISFIPGTSFTSRKRRSFSRYSHAGNPTKQSLSSQIYFTTLTRASSIFPQLRNEHPPHHRSRVERVSATGTDVAAEEQDIRVTDEASAEEVDTNKEASAKSDVSSAPTRATRRRGRKSDMPPVKDEDLVPGAIFTGKVRSIQPFGAFVDFGAFTDGLVHLSRLSDGFVKDVNDVVSLGQEVKVRVVEVNMEAGRISLSMRDDDGSKKRADAAFSGGDKPRSSGKNAPKPGQKKEQVKKASKFVMGQELVGTVKGFGRSGAFISLPEGEEGFLPISEEANEGPGTIMGQSSLEIGQEVNVRVLRIARGIVTLTMKKQEDEGKSDLELTQDIVHTATNPFAVAFHRNKDIAAFLAEREKIQEQGKVESSESVSDVVNDLVDGKDESFSTKNGTMGEDASPEFSSSNDREVSSVSCASQGLDVASPITGEEADVKSEDTDSEVQAGTPVPENGDDINETSSMSQELLVETQIENSGVREEDSEVSSAEAKVESSSPEGNGSVTSTAEGIDESSPEGSIPKGLSIPSHGESIL